MSWRYYLILAVVCGLMLSAPLWRWEWPSDDASVDPSAFQPGCKGDFVSGLLECKYVFADRTFIYKRGY